MGCFVSKWSSARFAAVVVGLVAPAIVASSYMSPAAWAEEEIADVRLEQHVRPLLTRLCQRCHGPTLHKAELDLSSVSGLLKGSESGPVVVPGKPDESELYKLVASGEMPPEPDKRLSRDEVALVRRWIEAGAVLNAPQSAARTLHQHDILPILMLRCATCHGRQKQEGGLDVRSRAALLKGGKSGPALVLAKPDQSLLVQRIHAGEMPPKKQLAAASVKPVESGELEKLRRWIADGAPELEVRPDAPNGEPDSLVSEADRRFWSFQPPRHVDVPLAAPSPLTESRGAHAIDAFVAQRLHEHQLTLAPAADRSTLARRLSFDLLGLPPSPDRVARFSADDSPEAYERLVDELLASPRYGERWAQYWLDLAGYSDSEGVQDSDLLRPASYRYRDYVLRAFNSDKSYERFLWEQLAGDELADYERAPTITPELYDNLVATGFLGMTADGTFSGITGFVPDRLDVIDDQLKIVGGGLLGLTIGCARCHSHKFDPIPQRDYYRLAAIFKGALDEHDWLKPTRQGGPPGTSDRLLPYVTTEERKAWEDQERGLQARIDELKARLPALASDAETKKATEEQIKALEAQRRSEPLVRAVWDRGEPSPTYVLLRGNYLTPGRLVGPGFPSALTDGQTPLDATPPWPAARKTGLRLALARWMTRPEHPLTARVFVNRVWKHHFGDGLVRTLDNFGRAGDPPSHPELLDWLARRFVSDGWSVKSLHRLIVTSATYRQSSSVSAKQLELDPENRLLSRFPLRRLDAEALYDSLLALADQLDARQFGPPDGITARPDGLVTSASASGARRRSIYVLQRRTQPLTLLADFDRPSMSPNCVARAESTVAPQALHLLNNALVHELSVAFAERVIREVGDDVSPQVDRVHAWACGVPLSGETREFAVTQVNELRERWRRQLQPTAGANVEREAARRALGNYAHAVMNSAGFVFVD